MAQIPVNEFVGKATRELIPEEIPFGFEEYQDPETLYFIDEEPASIPTAAEILAKAEELRDAYSMEALREERDKLLAETDWMATADRTMTDAETAYRQALRDLPADYPNAEKQDDGTWLNVTFPTKP